MDTIKVKGSIKKKILLVLGGLLFTMAGLVCAISPENVVSHMYRNTFFIRIVGIIGVLFFGFGSIKFIYSFFTKKYYIIISDEGIFDNSNPSSVGLIKWDDIISIQRIKIISVKFLMIKVKNPQKYINAKHKLYRKAQMNDFKLVGTPILISTNTLNYSFDKFEEIILKAFSIEKSKRS